MKSVNFNLTGLGTSTSVEAKEYFSDMQRHRIKFKYLGKNDDDNITMAFSKKCIEQRKDWLTNWMETTKARREMGMAEDIIYSKDVRSITYTEFINKELVLFSNLDNSRSIPSLVDGLKPGQRKVVFTCLKRNDKREVKVAQLAGSVAEHSAYHHGEQSLMSTIIGLAQNYVGSNNINILQPIGQFGTRLQGGKDAASPRYIFTQLSPLAKDIFNPKDAPLLNTLFDDSQRIEPEYYVPLIPMVLVNGADGIGTGWMTKIPNFNPREIVANIRRMIEGQDPVRMKPWYKGFQGEIVEISGQKYACNGEVSILHHGRDIEITELPVGTWTQTYKESVMEVYSNGTDKIPALINDYKEYHTDTTVKFLVSMKEDQFRKHENEGFHKSFKLQSSINLTSMVLFDRMGCLKRYADCLIMMHGNKK
jgi:DNA topoisomerase-2